MNSALAEVEPRLKGISEDRFAGGWEGLSVFLAGIIEMLWDQPPPEEFQYSSTHCFCVVFKQNALL